MLLAIPVIISDHTKFMVLLFSFSFVQVQFTVTLVAVVTIL